MEALEPPPSLEPPLSTSLSQLLSAATSTVALQSPAPALLPQALFEAVAKKDYESLALLFATNAQQAVASYLCMKRRWQEHAAAATTAAGGSSRARSEEKMDEFLQQMAYQQDAQQQQQQRRQSPPSNRYPLSPANHHSSSPSSSSSFMSSEEEAFATILRELALFLSEKSDETAAAASEPNSQQWKRKRVEVSADAEQLLRDASAFFSETRPPSNFVVYETGQIVMINNNNNNNNNTNNNQTAAEGANNNNNNNNVGPPIFDGSVANATPPPLGGAAGAAGGAGTILHLACALDVPLALAFLLAMGADARACHTAFRRVMIHEAACNGSIQCLTLLLELGQKYGTAMSQQEDVDSKMPAPPTTATRPGRDPYPIDLPFLPRRVDRNGNANSAFGAVHPVHYYSSSASSSGVGMLGGMSPFQLYASPPKPLDMQRKLGATVSPLKAPENQPVMDFISMLRLFRSLYTQVKKGVMTELDAARQVLDQATLCELSKASLIRCCSFRTANNNNSSATYATSHLYEVTPTPRSFLRPHGGSSDGHGNTPLHWAAFKNESACVSLLLQYKADPNARAYPSGWTPLHDAAYSNSKECIALLIDAGAAVDARANSGATPLCFAAQEDAADAAQLLLERGADLMARCAGGPVRDDGTVVLNTTNANHPHSRFSGYTPLHYCAHYNAAKAARVLLRHRSAAQAMEIADLSDRLPIHVAVARGSSDVLRELLHAGARVETRDRSASRDRSNSYTTNNSNSHSNSSGSSRRERQRRRRRPRSAVVTPGTNSASTAPPGTPVRTVTATATPPSPERPRTPRGRSPAAVTPVSSPVLRSMIPSQPVTSTKPWNCLSQRSIDECKLLISQAEQSWAPDRHSLFTPTDRRAVLELLRVGKRLELNGTGIFTDLWPQVLSFCGRGWFEVEDDDDEESLEVQDDEEDEIEAESQGVPDFAGPPSSYSRGTVPVHNANGNSNNETTTTTEDSLSLPQF